MTHRCAEMSLRLHFKSTHVHLRYCKPNLYLLSHVRSSMLHSLWLPVPKARWPRTTWMFSKISGRNKCASWLRLWMTSPLWMISFLCQVWASTNSSQTDWLKQMIHMLLNFPWSEWVIERRGLCPLAPNFHKKSLWRLDVKNKITIWLTKNKKSLHLKQNTVN